MPKFRRRISFACVATIVAAQFVSCGRTTAEDKLLTEVVNFTGTITYLNTKVPGFWSPYLFESQIYELQFWGTYITRKFGKLLPMVDTHRNS